MTQYPVVRKHCTPQTTDFEPWSSKKHDQVEWFDKSHAISEKKPFTFNILGLEKQIFLAKNGTEIRDFEGSYGVKRVTLIGPTRAVPE